MKNIHKSTTEKDALIQESHLPTNDPLKEKKLTIREKVAHWYQRLPDKKRYVEFITALLTIPVLLTVIILNLQNLKNSSSSNATPTPTPFERGERPPRPSGEDRQPSISPTISSTPTPQPTPSEQCKKEVGPISIVYPEEGSLLSKDPVCLDIVRSGEDYCSVVWSYRINGSAWSDYTDKSICMYGLTAGSKTVELRVKSIVSTDETLLTRTFTILGTATPTSTSTSSATLGM